MPTVILHISNEDPVMGEIDALPNLTDNLIMVKHPRRRDGKDVSYLDMDVTTVFWPISRVNYIEVLPSQEEEEIITFVRE